MKEPGRADITSPDVPVGLCVHCRFHRIVESGRGSRFWLCLRSRFDPRFPKYPRLPVLACAGYLPGEPANPSPDPAE